MINLYPVPLRVAIASWRDSHGYKVEIHKDSELEYMRTVPILAITGVNGSGKSLVAAELCRRALAEGRRCLSTTRLLDWENPRPCAGGDSCDDPVNHDYDGRVHGAAHPLYTRWTRWGQVDEMGTRFVLWADEVTGVAGSRDTSSLPKFAQDLFAQLRRRDAQCLWTGISFERGDLLLREVSQGVITCRGYAGKIAPGSGRKYAQKRMFRWQFYEKGAGDVSTSQLIAPGPLAASWFWGPGSKAFLSYDTLAPVSRIGRVIGTGVCETCEGSRRRDECICPDYVGRKAGRRAGSPSGGRAGLPAVIGDEQVQSWAS